MSPNETVKAVFEPLLLTIQQTAALLNCSTKSVRRLIQRGKFRPCKALRKILIPRYQIEAFIKETCGAQKAVSYNPNAHLRDLSPKL